VNELVYDILIKNAVIIDGTGAPRQRGDLAVKDGKIAKMGDIDGVARRCIDATGKILAPGFIDVHNHADLFLLDNSRMDTLARQGITTFSAGHCGLGSAPAGKGDYLAALMKSYGIKKSDEYDSFGEWLLRVQEKGVMLNFIPFCGHGAIRGAILGQEYKRLSTTEEVDDICESAEEALSAGAFGISTGFDGTWAGTFADHNEQLRVAEIVAKYNSIYSCHTRHHQYGWAAAESLNNTGYGVFCGPVGEAFYGRYHGQLEAIEVARQTGVRLHIAHLSTPYLVHQPHPAWLDEKLAEAATEEMIDRNRREGMDVSFNVIPLLESIAAESPILSWFQRCMVIDDGMDKVTNNSEFITNLYSVKFPEIARTLFKSGKIKFAWIHPLVDPYWFDCFLILSTKNKERRGKILGEILREKRRKSWTEFVYYESFDLLVDLLREDPEATWAPVVDKRQYGFRTFLKHPYGMIASDLIIPRPQKDLLSPYGVSPYTTNLFPSYIRHTVCEEGVLSLEEGIKKITSFPARYLFRLPDRGVLKEGAYADLVVFSLEEIAGKASFDDPLKPPEGIAFVIVNGRIIDENNNIIEGTPGCVIRRT
jgi:N-acyl-D-aspartate/D-glutamate deacylase